MGGFLGKLLGISGAGGLGAGAQAYGPLQGAERRNNPAEAAFPHLNGIPQFGREAYTPFIQQGQQAGNQLSGEYSNLLNSNRAGATGRGSNPLYDQLSQQMSSNPTGYLNNILGQYAPSQNYQFKRDQLQKAASNTAAAGGARGNQNDVMGQTELVNALLNGDIQQFLQNVLGIQGAGMHGLENDLGRQESQFGRQANAYGQGLSGLQQQQGLGFYGAGSLADYLGNASTQRAGFGAYGQDYANNAKNQVFKSLSSLLSSGLGQAGGGGF